ncbi:hypothetical protein ACWDE9_41045, partial [Streptomyces olivaceoviridis]
MPSSPCGAGRPARRQTTSRPAIARTSPAGSSSAAGAVRTTVPSRSTVSRSTTAITWSMWCEMRTTATPSPEAAH